MAHTALLATMVLVGPAHDAEGCARSYKGFRVLKVRDGTCVKALITSGSAAYALIAFATAWSAK